jgi:hypothetical protein
MRRRAQVKPNTVMEISMKKQALALVKSLPPEMVETLGPPPLLPTEDEELYYATLARFAKDIAPTDTITWLLMKDLVDYRIEIARCRRFKASIVTQAAEDRIRTAIANHKTTVEGEIKVLRAKADIDLQKAERLTPYDASKIEARKAEIEACFESQAAAKRDGCDKTIKAWEGLALQEKDLAGTFPYWIVGHDKLEQVLEIAEQKFFATLREIERHIFGFAKTLREELKIIEGEVLERIEAEPTSA